MVEKVLFSAEKDHDVIKNLINFLKQNTNFQFIFHDPTTEFLSLHELESLYGDVSYFIVKVRNECSLDLLYFAKYHGIPCLQDIDSVLMCKNKVSLDIALRKLFEEHSNSLQDFHLPLSWIQSVMNPESFKDWAKERLPIVLKSHYQNDKYIRFNFLMQKIEELDYFRKRYAHALYYNIYVQEFIESDGIDRKIYVVGDEIFGIKRENPIYKFLRENPESIDCDELNRAQFKISEEIEKLAKLISSNLGIKIFGFDLIKPLNKDGYYFIDLNYFPGFRGIDGIDQVMANFIINQAKKTLLLD